jgi:hypothetical protein
MNAVTETKPGHASIAAALAAAQAEMGKALKQSGVSLEIRRPWQRHGCLPARAEQARHRRYPAHGRE